MTLQDLIPGVDLSKVKLIRHNITHPEVARNSALGYIEYYQRIQTPNRLKGCEYVFSFLGEQGTEGKLIGCYRVSGYVPLSQGGLPNDLYLAAEPDGLVCWTLEKTDILADLADRLVIDWGKGAISWCQNGANAKEVLYILPMVSAITFVSYDKVLLPYEKLKYIVSNTKEHWEWQNKLSAVAGVYLITDTKTGKQYVGSASGESGGIWGRWSEYAHTKHGGNKRLIELMNADADYCDNFQFSILEVFPIKRDKHEILNYEQLYKRKLLTVQFGYNDN